MNIKDVLYNADGNADITAEKQMNFVINDATHARYEFSVVPRSGKEYIFFVSEVSGNPNSTYATDELADYVVKSCTGRIMCLEGDSVLYHKMFEGLVPGEEAAERAIASGSEDCFKCSYDAIKGLLSEHQE